MFKKWALKFALYALNKYAPILIEYLIEVLSDLVDDPDNSIQASDVKAIESHKDLIASKLKQKARRRRK